MGIIIEVLETTQTPLGTNVGQSVVEVISPAKAIQATIGFTEPVNPFEGQVFIDIS